MAIRTLFITALVREREVESVLAEAARAILTHQFPMPLQNIKTFSPAGISSDLRREIVFFTADVDGSEQDAMKCAESIANFVDGIVGLQDAQWGLAWT